MKTGNPITVNGVTFHRINVAAVQVGDELYRCVDGSQVPSLFGTVTEVEHFEGTSKAKRVTLSTGERLTHRGWSNKRLWRKA